MSAAIKLTPRQRLILRVAEFYYQDGIDAIASITNLKPHTVRYDLREMTEMGVFTPSLHFNESCFGYYIFHIHLATQPNHIDALEAAFRRSSRVVFMAILSGKRSLGMTILSKKPEDLFATIDAVGAQAKVPFSQVGWCIEGDFYHYGASAVLRERAIDFETVQSWQGERVDIDHLDARIIQAAKRKRLVGTTELAREVGIPASKVQYRLNRLQDSGVMLRRSAMIDCVKLGYAHFEVLIRCSIISPEVGKLLRSFCKNHPAIHLLIRCFGDWDYKLVAHAIEMSEVLDLDEALQKTLGSKLASSVIVPVRRVTKVGDFPAEDYEE